DPDTDPYLTDIEGSVERAQGGHYLGGILRGQTHRGDLAIGTSAGMIRSFYTSDFDAFRDNHLNRYRPFLLQIDSGDSRFGRPYFLVKASGSQAVHKAIGGVWSRLAFKCPVTEAWSEAA